MKTPIYGEKLENATISDKAWIAFRDEFESEGSIMSRDTRTKCLARLKELYAEFGVGENEGKCVLCGEPVEKDKGICHKCFAGVEHRGMIRQCGKIHGCNNRQVRCYVCESNLGWSMGMCRRCYRFARRKGFSNAKDYKRAMSTVGFTDLNSQ